MKKLFVVFVLMFILVSSLEMQNNFTLQDYFNGDYVFYTEENVATNSTNLGFCYSNTGTSLNKSVEIVGESITVKDLEVDAALNVLNAKLINTEYLEDGTIVIYAYSTLINKDVKINNKKVNLQIALKDEYSVIGWPLILGSF